MHHSFIAALTLVAIAAGPACAIPMKFIHSGMGHGTIGGTTFNTTPFTITALGDTDNRASPSPSNFYINHSLASIDIDGVGSFQFITGTRTFLAQFSGIVGFSRAGDTGIDLYNGPFSSQLWTWDMLTGIGPLFGGGNLDYWDIGQVVTSGGVLEFEHSTWAATFQAIIVPEPASAALILMISVVLTGSRRRRHAMAASRCQ